MSIKEFVWINYKILLFIGLLFSCSDKENNFNTMIKNNKKMDSVLNTLPVSAQHIFFISPTSKCLFCDKQIFELVSNQNVIVFASPEKYILFMKDRKINLREISESDFRDLFSKKYADFSKYVLIEDKQIKWIQNITPQYVDTLLDKINHLESK